MFVLVFTALWLFSQTCHSAVIALNDPLVRAGTSGALDQKNFTLQVKFTDSANPLGETGTITLTHPLGNVSFVLHAEPRRVVTEVVDFALIPSDLAVTVVKHCDGAQVIINDPLTNSTNITLVATTDPLSDQNDFSLGLSDSGGNDTTLSGLTNPGRQLLASSSDEDCAPGEQVPCNACRAQVAESQDACRDVSQYFWISRGGAPGTFHTRNRFGHGTLTTNVFAAWWNSMILDVPQMQLINMPGFVHAAPTATCVTKPFNATAYKTDISVVPVADGDACIPIGLDALVTAPECVELGSPANCVPGVTTLLELSRPYDDTEFFTGSGPTVVFQRHLQGSLVERLDTCGINFRRGTADVTRTSLRPYDYFESVTNCSCTFRQLGTTEFGQRTCVLNLWDVQALDDGTFPLIPYVSKCVRNKGLWACAAFVTEELQRDVTTKVDNKYRVGHLPASICPQPVPDHAKNPVTGQTLTREQYIKLFGDPGVSPACSTTLNDLASQEWGTNNTILDNRFGTVLNGSLSSNSMWVGSDSPWSGSSVVCTLTFGQVCDDPKYHIVSTDSDNTLYAAQQTAYSLAEQARAIDGYVTGQSQMLDSLQRTQAGVVLLAQRQLDVNTLALSEVQATLQASQTLVRDIGAISDKASQLELATQKFTGYIQARYADLTSQLDGTASVIFESQNSLGDELESMQRAIALAQVVQANIQRNLERINQLTFGATQFQRLVQTQLIDMRVDRARYRRLNRGISDAIRHSRSLKGLAPFMAGPRDVWGNVGQAPLPLLSSELITATDMIRAYYLTPVFLQHVPADDPMLLADIFEAANNMSLGEPVTALDVAAYLDTNPHHVQIHQLSMQWLCDTEALINFMLPDMRVEDIRDMTGPPSCILGTHMQRRKCMACRAKLLHRTCVRTGANADTVAAELLDPDNKAAISLAMDSTTFQTAGFCTGPVEVRVPIWNKAAITAGPNATEPIDTGNLAEVDRFWLDACAGRGNDPLLSPFPSEDDLAGGPVDPNLQSVANLPCATSFNDTLFNVTCLGIQQQMVLKSPGLNPSTRGITLEAPLPIWNTTSLGGFMVYSDGNNRLVMKNLTYDPTQCAADRFSNNLFMVDNGGRTPVYYAIQQALVTATLARTVSPIVKQAEARLTGSLPLGQGIVVVQQTVEAPNETPSDAPPVNLSATTSDLWVSPTTGGSLYDPQLAPFLQEQLNQTATQTEPVIITDQAVLRNNYAQAVQRARCDIASFVSTSKDAIPLYRHRFVEEQFKVTLRWKHPTGDNATENLINNILGLMDQDFVDRGRYLQVRSSSVSLFAEEGYDLPWAGYVTCAGYTLPANYSFQPFNESNLLLSAVNHTQLGCPLAQDGFTDDSKAPRAWFIYDLPLGAVKRGVTHPSGTIDYISQRQNFNPNQRRYMNGFQKALMFDYETYAAERGLDPTRPHSPQTSFNPVDSVTSPRYFLTQLQRDEIRDPTNSSIVHYTFRCLKPPDKWNRACQILDRYRLVTPPFAVTQGDPNPENWPQWYWEANDDQDEVDVFLQIPESLVVKLVEQGSPCPTGFVIRNIFTVNASLEFRPPLILLGNTTVEINIASTSVGHACNGIQYFQMQAGAPPLITIPLSDCQPVSVIITKVSNFNGTVFLSRTPCWNWSATAEDQFAVPDLDNYNVVVQEELDSRTLILANAGVRFSQAIGALNQLLLQTFTINFSSSVPLFNASQALSLTYVLDILRNNSILSDPLVGGNGSLPLDTRTNLTYLLLNATTNATALSMDLRATLTGILDFNDTELAGVLSFVSDSIDSLNAVIEARQQALPSLQNLTLILDTLNVTVVNGIARFQALVAEAQNVSFVYSDTIALLKTEAFDEITPDVWDCLILFGQENYFGTNNPVGDALEASIKRIAQLKRDIWRAASKDREGVANFLSSVPKARMVFWMAMWFMAIDAVLVGIYFLFIRSGVCGKCSVLVEEGFAKEPGGASMAKSSRLAKETKRARRGSMQQQKRSSLEHESEGGRKYEREGKESDEWRPASHLDGLHSLVL